MIAEQKARDELLAERRWRPHGCWDHLIVAPLWVAYQANLGTLLRTCDAAGATRLADLQPARRKTIVLLGHEHHGIPADVWPLLDSVVEIPMVGAGASLNVAVAGSLVLHKLAGLA